MTMGIPGSTPTIDPDTAIQTEVSRRTLETIPGRALFFLRTIPGDKEIRLLLQQHGYSEEAHNEGWSRLLGASGYGAPVASSDGSDEAARAAAAAVDDIDEKVFRITAATLTRRFPSQAQFVLHDISASRGPSSVLNTEILLNRLDALENAPEREATREQDRAAIALLAKRGISTAERTRLRGLIATAKRMQPVVEAPVDAEAADAQYVARLVELRDWYVEWSEIAKAVIGRRDRLIRLGLATPRTRETSDESEAPPGPLPVAAPGV